MAKKKRTGRKKKEKRISEFRKERTREAEGHPRYFFKKRGKTFFGFKITHGGHVDGNNTIPLTGNPEPNPKDKRPARIGTEIIPVSEGVLSNRLPWKFNAEDEEIVIALIKQAEEKQRKKK